MPTLFHSLYPFQYVAPSTLSPARLGRNSYLYSPLTPLFPSLWGLVYTQLQATVNFIFWYTVLYSINRYHSLHSRLSQAGTLVYSCLLSDSDYTQQFLTLPPPPPPPPTPSSTPSLPPPLPPLSFPPLAKGTTKQTLKLRSKIFCYCHCVNLKEECHC
jgi:hypothetical protein